jgi:hypothetical protein
MLYHSLIGLSYLGFGVGLVAGQADCPVLPPFEFGPPVPINPDDIPTGCSPYEVLVARGTSEINFEPDGKFGVVVGDPVVSNLTRVLDGVQGYPVQTVPRQLRLCQQHPRRRGRRYPTPDQPDGRVPRPNVCPCRLLSGRQRHASGRRVPARGNISEDQGARHVWRPEPQERGRVSRGASR